MKYRAVVFDLDGTLLDTDLYIALNYVHMFEKFRPTYVPHLSELISFSGPTLQTVFAEYFPTFKYEILFAEFKKFSDQNAVRYSKLYDHEIECLNSLATLGYQIGVVTSKKKEAAMLSLSSFDLAKYIEFIITPDDVDKPKPYPEGLLKIIAQMELQPSEVLYIGDSYIDYLTGLAANTAIGLVTWGLHKMPEGTDPDYQFASYQNIEEVLKHE